MPVDLIEAKKGDAAHFDTGLIRVVDEMFIIPREPRFVLRFAGADELHSFHRDGTRLDGPPHIVKLTPSTQSPLPFWLVLRTDGGHPKTKHPTEQSARNEAERLAGQHPGAEFVVLRAVAACRTREMGWTEYGGGE